jgi:cytochrome c
MRLFAFAAVAALVSTSALAAGDPAAGQKLFTRCVICHTAGAGEANRMGPNLHGLFDRPAGKAPGFHYTPGLAKATFHWDDAKLDRWLTNPGGLIPGAAMVLRTDSPKERQDLIAYLRQATK